MKNIDRARVLYHVIFGMAFVAMVISHYIPKPQVQEICFTFVFGRDKLDPGESMAFYGPVGIDGAGFVNLGNMSQDSRTLCFNRKIDRGPVETLATMPEAITFIAEAGTVDIESVTVSVRR